MTVQFRDETQGGVDNAHIAEICRHDPMLARSVHHGMGRIETLLLASLSEGEDFLAEPAMHLFKSGGKRFRPLVTTLGAHFGERPADESVIAAAAAVEMLHLATLHHDDVMDESVTRRGVPTVSTRWSNTVAILSGDYLIARAGHLLLGHAEHVSALEKMYETVTMLVTGQMREASRADGCYDSQIYLRTVQEKTASLISLSAWLGATSAGAPPETVDTLERVGDLLGVVFQIADDIIDLTVPTHRLGKPQGLDLRQGVATLPVIYALDEDTPAARDLAALLAEPFDDDETTRRAIDLIRHTDGLVRAEATMAAHIEQAHALLEGMAPGPVRTALGRLFTFIATRTC
ncbi:polyprenyl synthetase family protein [Nocardia higoensis]|uniref:polyprenyl synthetase family protein n=1 Tax=Nocardia higoensis TaxID=228599 RepID=UPI00031FE70C|nr:polyprenyl synthetase family protein [Nocardia higoensis]